MGAKRALADHALHPVTLTEPRARTKGLVAGILANHASWKYSAVCGSTIVAYTVYTLGITQWRTKFRKEMIARENEASAQVR